MRTWDYLTKDNFGLRCCSKNRKVHGSNPTRRSAGLETQTSLRGRKCQTQWLTSGECGCPLDNAQSWVLGNQIAIKKINTTVETM